MKHAFIILATVLFVIGTAQAQTYYPQKNYNNSGNSQAKSGQSYPSKGNDSSSRSAKQQSNKSYKNTGKSAAQQKPYYK